VRYDGDVRAGWVLVVAGSGLTACRGSARHEVAPGVARPQPPLPPAIPAVATVPAAPGGVAATFGCAPDLPAAACDAFRTALGSRFAPGAAVQLAACAPDDPARVGEWRYALVSPLYTATDNATAAELAAMWTGGKLVASDDTRRFLAARLGAPGGTPGAPDTTSWAIVPADTLSPAWHVVTVDGVHPLAPGDGPLAIPLCARGAGVRVTNLDPAEVTTVAMTGVTALARFTAKLMDRKGTTYPARDIAAWFEHTDFVHVSNEVSFVATCKPKGDPLEEFCARDEYIELLEAIHTNIVELDGSHLADFGRDTFARTIDMYDARGWQHFGGGRDQLDATRPIVVEHAGTKLAFVGCNMPHSTSHTIRNGPDVGYCDMARLIWQVRDLRAQGIAPIVAIQHEEVYKHDPPDILVADFRKLAAAGAAVVFGSQAHWAHPFEVDGDAYVHFGAGNLFFDQSWPGARDATADRLYFHRGRLISVGHLFTRLEEAGKPRPMTDREREVFLGVLATALGKLPKPKLVAPPVPATIPDSLLVGSEAILLSIAPGDHTHVTLRRKPKARAGLVEKAVRAFMAAKYAVDPKAVALR
jgi:poly-gamma-glutamate capsule biosynthesis protein CapA/YwtB (metallophosphatase superfamily)